MSVSDLLPWADNPRKISDTALAGLGESISRFGLVQPVVWNRRTHRVVGGHQRLKVLHTQGVKEIDVVVVDLPEIEERALNLALNNGHISGTWTPGARDLLKELSGAFDGFKDLKLDSLLDDLGRTNLRDALTSGASPEDDAVEPPQEPATRPGDLWRLGPHRLLCADATDANAITRLMDGNRAHAVITDPPYGVDYSPKERRTGRRPATTATRKILNDALPAPELQELLKRAFAVMDTALEEGAAVYVFGPAGWEARLFYGAWPEEAWHFQAGLVWDKGRFALSRWDFHPRHETVLYGWKKGAQRMWLGGRRQSSVLEFEMGSGSHYVHPTQKPVGLIRRLLINSVPEGGVVLDSFGGSGSTIIAAETCGRVAYLCELDPCFVDAAVARWERYSGQKAERTERPS